MADGDVKCPYCGIEGKEIVPCTMAPMKKIHYIGASECLTRQLAQAKEENERLSEMFRRLHDFNPEKADEVRNAVDGERRNAP